MDIGFRKRTRAEARDYITVLRLTRIGRVYLLSDLTLTDLQSASSQFTLATISFDGVGLGTSLLQFINVGVGGNDIKDANDTVLSPTLETGSVTVAATVPEPSPLLLLGIGLLWMAFPITLRNPHPGTGTRSPWLPCPFQ